MLSPQQIRKWANELERVRCLIHQIWAGFVAEEPTQLDVVDHARQLFQLVASFHYEVNGLAECREEIQWGRAQLDADEKEDK